MSENEREEIIYHGTTKSVADAIVKAQKFDESETYFASEKSLAQYFANRANDKRPKEGGAAVVSVKIYESDLKQWRETGSVKRLPFDKDDAPELKNKIQLVFNGTAMEQLNKVMFKDTLKVE